MTESRRRALPHPAVTFTSALALFLALLVLLAWQVRAGRDPALSGQQKTAQVVKPAARRVLVRKVIRKVIDDKIVVIHPAPVPQQVAAPAYSGSAPSSSAGYSAPATYSAPAPATYSAPAPVYSAPAPAPAPAVTRTS